MVVVDGSNLRLESTAQIGRLGLRLGGWLLGCFICLMDKLGELSSFGNVDDSNDSIVSTVGWY